MSTEQPADAARRRVRRRLTLSLLAILAAVALAASGALAGSYSTMRRLVRRLPLPPAARRALTPGTRRTVVAVDGTHLAVTDVGHGPPILLAHGVGVTQDFWKHTQPHLVERGYRVITFDQRGHGDSTVGSDGFSIEALASDLATVIGALDLHDVVVVGHSMGGIGLQGLLVDVEPQVEARLRHAVLCSTTPRNDRTWSIFSALPGVDDEISLNLPRSVVDPMVREVMFGDHPPPPQAFIDDALELAARNDPRNVILSALALTDFDLRDRLEAVRVPTTVMCGDSDRVTVPRLSSMIAERLGVEAVWLDGAGHALPWERIPEFVELVDRVASGRSPQPPTSV